MRGDVWLHECALRHDVPAERAHAPFRLGVGEGQDGAGAAERAAERQQRRRARVDRAVVLVELLQEPLGVARRVLEPGHGQVAQQPHRDAGWCDLRVVVREDGRTCCRLCHRVVVRTRISHSRRRQREHGVGATVDGVARERGGLPGGGRAGSRDHGHGPGHRGADGFGYGADTAHQVVQ